MYFLKKTIQCNIKKLYLRHSMTKEDILNIKQLLSSPKQIVIVPHKNPDGDAIGSTLGLYHYLKKCNHNVTIIAPNDYPDFLKWIPGEATILKYDAQNEESNDLLNKQIFIFTLDFNAFNRIGDMARCRSKY